jgi:hypothetical protein
MQEFYDMAIDHPDQIELHKAGPRVSGLVWSHRNGHNYRILAAGQVSDTGESNVVFVNMEDGTNWSLPAHEFFGLNDQGQWRMRLNTTDKVMLSAPSKHVVGYLIAGHGVSQLSKNNWAGNGHTASPLVVDLLAGDLESSPAVAYHASRYIEWSRQSKECQLDYEAAESTPDCTAAEVAKLHGAWAHASNMAVMHYDMANDMRRMSTGDLPVNAVVNNTVDIQETVAGACFDLMGHLTCQSEKLVLSASDDAAKAVESLEKWAAGRGLPLNEANVRNWTRVAGITPTM